MNHGNLVAAAGLAVACTVSVYAQPVPVHVGNAGPHRNDGDALVPIGEGCGKALAAARRFAAGQLPEEDPEGWCTMCDVVEQTDVLNCALDVEVIPTTSTISGSNTFTVMSKVDGLTTFTFRLRSQFVISAATINGATAVPVANPTTTTRVATLDREYNNGEIFTLRIDYSGVPVSVGSFGSVDFTTQNGVALFQTLSEPYYSYTWWPCKDGDANTNGDNSDKFTAQVSITAPDPLKSVSNGLLQGVDVVAGSKSRYRWATVNPTTTYLIFICTTTYNQWEQTYSYPGGTMPVQFSIYPANDTAGNRAAWERCLSMMATYRPFYGEYPFTNEKYGIYNFNFSGGEEHQTYTGEGTFSESVTSHELGHQWWGDNITCKTWPDIWLNEGFATYTEAIWEQYKPGSTGWPAYFTAMGNRRPTGTTGTCYRTDVSSASTIFSTSYAYRKPAWVLHALRRVVGDATFWNIISTYRATYQGSAATTDDFKNIASAVYGQDLTWFFDEWIYGPGAPAYASGWQTVNINGQNYLRLRIRQTETTPAAPLFFTMPITVRVNTSGGPQYINVWNNERTEWYVVPINAPATGIVVDQSAEATPSPWILTTANVIEAYGSGPPKIVQAAPQPGAIYAPGAGPSQLAVTFSENVTTTGADYVLTGPSGTVPLSLGYSPANFTATLDAGSPLPAGSYSLRVRDTVVSVAAAARLDGEISNATSASSLPSGEGQPQGDAIWTFTVQGSACYANCDGSTTAPVLNVLDFSCFLNQFAGGETYANCDGSTTPPVLNVLDFSCFLNVFAAGCP